MRVDLRYKNAFAPWQGVPVLSKTELGRLRERAWREQGILVIAPSDARLSAGEKTTLCRIGERLFNDPTEMRKETT